MATSKRLKIIIDAVNEASRELKEIEKELKGVENAAGKGGKNVEGFGDKLGGMKIQALAVTAAVAGLAVAVKKGLEWGREGAAVGQLEESFDSLLESVDAAPDLFDQLKEAGGGTVDNMTLMSSTAKLLAGTTGELSQAMADAAPRLLEISRAAVKLDPTIGTVSQTFEALAKGIKKNQPLLIDNANIAVKVGAANKRMAEQLGKTVEQLTEEEKAMALLNDTIRAGDEIIEQVGGTVDSAVDPFDQLTTATKNLTDAWKEEFSPAAADVAEWLTEVVVLNAGLRDAKQEVNAAEEAGRISQMESWQIKEQLRLGIIDETEAMRQLTEAEKSYVLQSAITVTSDEQRARGLSMSTGATKELNAAIDENIPRMKDIYAQQAAIVEQNTHLAIAKTKEEFKGAALAAMDYIQSLKDATAVDIATDAMDRLETAMENVNINAEGGPELFAALYDEWKETGLQSGILDEKQIAQAESQNAVWKAYEDSVLPLEKYGEAAELTRQKVEEGLEPQEALNTALEEYSTTYIPDAEKAMLGLKDGALPQTADAIDTFTDETLEGMKEGFELTTQEAGRLKGGVYGVETALDDVDGARADTYIYTHHIDAGGGGYDPIAYGESPFDYQPGGGASGLQMIVGPGYHGDSFLFGANTGERVTIETKDQQQRGGRSGGSGGFTFVYAPKVSMGDPEEVEQIIAPAIEKVYRSLVREDGVNSWR